MRSHMAVRRQILEQGLDPSIAYILVDGKLVPKDGYPTEETLFVQAKQIEDLSESLKDMSAYSTPLPADYEETVLDTATIETELEDKFSEKLEAQIQEESKEAEELLADESHLAEEDSTDTPKEKSQNKKHQKKPNKKK